MALYGSPDTYGDFIETTAPKPFDGLIKYLSGFSDPYVAYIAGPMSGKPNYNFDEFDAVEAHIEANGLAQIPPSDVTVLNPAKNFGRDQTLPRRKYLSLAIRQVSTSNAIVLLPDWTESEGTLLEVETALDCGLDFYFAGQNVGGLWYTLAADRELVAEMASAYGNLSPDPEIAEKAQASIPPALIEEEAGRLVRRGARQQEYGHPRWDFRRIARIWSGILDIEITKEQVAVCMSGLKLARLAETPQHRDSKVDAIGYIVCLDLLNEEADDAVA